MNKAASGESPIEVELKLVIDPGDTAALCQSPVLTDIPADDQEQITTYFDTPAGELRAAGIALRVRKSGARYVQTIKTGNAAGAGLFARPEWEQDVSGSEPALDDASPLHAMVDESVLSRIHPAFTVAVRRRSWQVATADAAIELFLDEGVVTASGREAPVAEIEAELKDGAPDALFSLARSLSRALPLRLGVLTKAERGYRLQEDLLDAPVKAERLSLDSEADVAEAFAAIAGSCLRQFRLNEDVLRNTPHPDALHQARVALRRLRSALSLFKPVVSDDRFDHFSNELRHLARALGPARDLDVMIGNLGSSATQSIQAARDQAYATALATLDSQRTRDLMIELVAWIAVGDWRMRPADRTIIDQPADRFAGAAMTKLRRRLKKRGSHLADLDDHARHEVRKLAKKARYATEFFAPLFTGKKARRRHKLFRKKLTALQEHLGALNDLAAAPSLMKRHDLDHGAVSLGDKERLLTKAAKAQKALIKAKRFW